MRIRSLLIGAILLTAPVFHASAQDTLTAEKRSDIETFLELTDALALGQQMSQAFTAQLVNALSAANPSIPQEVVDAASEVVAEVVTDELPAFTEQVIQLYDRYFTHDEIRGFIEFYSTDLGRKATRVLPQLTQESMMAGQVWGQSLQTEIDRRLRERLQNP